jgi:hypothetical protein
MTIDKTMYKIYCSGCSVVIFGTMWSMQHIYLSQFFWKFHISEILRNLILNLSKHHWQQYNYIWKHSSVNAVTRDWAGQMRNSGSIPNRDRDFSVLHYVQTGSWAHQTSYPVGTGDLSLEVKWAGMKRPLTSI